MSIVGEAWVAIRPETTTFGRDVKGKLAAIIGAEGPGIQSAVNKVGLGALAGGAAIVGISVKLEESLTKVQGQIAANADISVAAATKITTAFQSTAFNSIFSAQQMGAAYGKVAGQLGDLAGHALNAKEALNFMKVASDLAEASGGDLGSTTATLSKIMQGFELKLGDAKRTSDALFTTSRITATGVDQLGQVMVRLHTRLGIAAGSVQNLGSIMVDLAEHGVAGGARGLMVLNSAMQALVSPGDKVKQQQKDLGLAFFNTRGQFVGFRGVLEQLTPRLKGLNDEQAIAFLRSAGLGGQAKSLLDTIRAGPAAYDKAAAAVNKNNAAHAAAEKQSQTFHAAVEKLKAGLVDMGEKIGAAIIPKIMGLAHAIGDVINWFEHHKKVAEALAVVLGSVLAASAISTLVTAIINLGSKIAGSIASLFTWGTTAETESAGAATSMEAALATISAAVTGIAEQMGVAVETAGAAMEETAANATVAGATMDVALGPVGLALLAVAAIALLVATHWKTVSRVASEVGKAIVRFFEPVVAWFKANWIWLVRALLAPFTAGLTLIIPLLIKFHDQIIGFFEKLPGEIFGWGEKILKGLLDGFIAYEKFIFDFWTKLPGRILDALGDVGKWLWDTGKKIIEGLVSGAEEGIKALPGLAGKIGGGLIDAVGGLFGISSPSRVFHGFGVNIMQGLANGISSSAALPNAALSRLALTAPQLPGFGPLVGGAGAAQQTQLLTVLQQLTHETRLNTQAVSQQTVQSRQPTTVKLQQPPSSATSPIANLVSGITR